MATLLHRLGLAAVRHRFAVIAIWLVALVAVGTGAAMLSGKTVNTFEIPGQESTIALDLIEKHYGEKKTLGMKDEDPAVYDMLCKAESVGVFQVESRAQMSMLPRLKQTST